MRDEFTFTIASHVPYESHLSPSLKKISTCLLFVLIHGTIARYEITAFLVTMIKQYKRPVLHAL